MDKRRRVLTAASAAAVLGGGVVAVTGSPPRVVHPTGQAQLPGDARPAASSANGALS